MALVYSISMESADTMTICTKISSCNIPSSIAVAIFYSLFWNLYLVWSTCIQSYRYTFAGHSSALIPERLMSSWHCLSLQNSIYESKKGSSISPFAAVSGVITCAFNTVELKKRRYSAVLLRVALSSMLCTSYQNTYMDIVIKLHRTNCCI